MELSHIDAEGHIRMVDVGAKPDTERVAVARGEVHMQPETLRLIVEDGLPKGDVLTTAHLAGVMAAKQTAHLIPLCHPLLLTKIDVEFEVDESTSRIVITATVRTRPAWRWRPSPRCRSRCSPCTTCARPSTGG